MQGTFRTYFRVFHGLFFLLFIMGFGFLSKYNMKRMVRNYFELFSATNKYAMIKKNTFSGYFMVVF